MGIQNARWGLFQNNFIKKCVKSTLATGAHLSEILENLSHCKELLIQLLSQSHFSCCVLMVPLIFVWNSDPLILWTGVWMCRVCLFVKSKQEWFKLIFPCFFSQLSVVLCCVTEGQQLTATLCSFLLTLRPLNTSI